MAKTDELLARLSNKEDNFTERKPNGAKRDELRKTIVAFANSLREGQTGVLYIGVGDDGSVQGVEGTDSLQKTIARICKDNCYPSISPSCSVLHKEGKTILAVEISASEQRPHFAGPAYVRIGSESKAASKELYEELLTSHCGIAGQLLKLKGAIVTVQAIDHKLGDTRRMTVTSFFREHECRIVEVHPTFVRLLDHASDITHSEPLHNIDLMKDEKRHRPLLVVRGGSH